MKENSSTEQEPAFVSSNGQDLFDIREGVQYFHQRGATAATPNFLRNLISNGKIPSLKVGKKLYVTKAGLDDWISRNERRVRS